MWTSEVPKGSKLAADDVDDRTPPDFDSSLVRSFSGLSPGMTRSGFDSLILAR